MLDEQEFAEIATLHGLGIQSVQQFRVETGAALKDVPLAERFNAMLRQYEDITGFRETNPSAVWHHRLSLYGPPCSHCGRPLRTPMANLCGSCMAPR